MDKEASDQRSLKGRENYGVEGMEGFVKIKAERTSKDWKIMGGHERRRMCVGERKIMRNEECALPNMSNAGEGGKIMYLILNMGNVNREYDV